MSYLELDTGDSKQQSQPEPRVTDKSATNNFTAQDAAVTGAAIAIPAGVGVAEFLTRNYEQYLPDVVKNVEDLAKRLPQRLKGQAAALFDRFYSQPAGPYSRNTDLGYIRTKQPAGSSYRNSAGYVTDVKGNPLYSSGGTPKPQIKMTPVFTNGVAKLIPTLVKGLSAAGLAYSAYDTVTDLAGSLQRGEGFARLFNGGEQPRVTDKSATEAAAVEEGTAASNNAIPQERTIAELNADLDRERAKYNTSAPTPRVTDKSATKEFETTVSDYIPTQRPAVTITPTDDGDVVISSSQGQQYAPPAYDPALDPRNARYIQARNALGPNATAEEIKLVEDLGMAIHQDIYR